MGLKAWNVSSFLLRGLAIWLHELGRATVAWLSGRRAIPLPLGWTNDELERSPFVYIGLLVLLGLLFRAAARDAAGRRSWRSP